MPSRTTGTWNRRLAAARRRLTDVSLEPAEARRTILAAMRSVVPADAALEYRAVRTSTGWAASADCVVEGDGFRHLYAKWAGSPIDSEVHSYDPELPDPSEAGRFTTIRDRHRRAVAYRRYYEPTGLQQARMLSYDGSAFVGWVGLLRNADRPPFDECELRALTSLSTSIVSNLAAVHRIERAQLDGTAPAHLVFTPEGRLENATEDVATWLTPDRRSFLSDFVRRVDREAIEATLLDGAELGARRLVGSRTVYLVNLRRARLPRRSRLAMLTKRRREIAEYAAAGATAKEIGETLDISGHTVRQHLKVIYHELGVGSRVELARMVEEVPSS